jgi:hypothetical protein
MGERTGDVRFEKCLYASLCWHALRRLGFHSEDERATDAEPAARLSGLADHFGFCAPVAGGPLFAFIYQIPSYADPQTPEAMDRILEVAKRVVRRGDADELLSEWPEAGSRWLRWYTRVALSETLDSLQAEAGRVDAALDEWAAYLRSLWADYARTLARKLTDYPFLEHATKCTSDNAFEAWEGAFSLDYPGRSFVVVPCPENPTLATSLGPDRIVIGAAVGSELVRHSVVHEIGVRLLAGERLTASPRLRGALRADPEGVLRLIEAEVCFRKPSLFPDLGEDLFLKGMALEPLVFWRGRQEPRGPFPEWLATLYFEAKRAGLIKPVRHLHTR